MRVRRGCGHRGHSPVPRRSPAGAGKPGWRGSERFSMQSLRPPWWAPVQWAAFSTLSRGGHLEGGTQPITRSILPPLGGICESPRGHKLWPPPESLSHGAPALGNPTEWGQGPLGLAHPTWPALGVKPTMGCRPVGSPPPCLQLSRTPLSCQPRKLPGAWEEHQKDLVGRREGAGASSGQCQPPPRAPRAQGRATCRDHRVSGSHPGLSGATFIRRTRQIRVLEGVQGEALAELSGGCPMSLSLSFPCGHRGFLGPCLHQEASLDCQALLLRRPAQVETPTNAGGGGSPERVRGCAHGWMWFDTPLRPAAIVSPHKAVPPFPSHVSPQP
ncbi:uncharacterized protein [Symphalangus syndactylus]|uniref:uncharacterized protein isoform X2 n=1 Tax=Symphalangus syndactylus TaxID=9590 RepID=UPI0024417224|nr:uncharacterized protein LOC129472210 isoform X1 [Symphalangus syndactylus]